MHPHVPIRAKPIPPNILLLFHRFMDPRSSLHSNVWACSLFLFYTLSRLGSMLPSSKSTPRHKFLSRDRVNRSLEGLFEANGTFESYIIEQYGRLAWNGFRKKYREIDPSMKTSMEEWFRAGVSKGARARAVNWTTDRAWAWAGCRPLV